MTDIFPVGELAALAATERPFQPGECAERARRAAVLIGQAGLLPDEAGASYVLWQDEHSVAWLNVIHRMDHDAGAITVHVYSPPLRAIGYYEVVEGLLQRVLGPPDEASPESPRLLAVLNRPAAATAGSRPA